MWDSKFASISKELICDRIGKNPYSKELTNLILTRIDMETTFMHHALPGAIDFLYKLFGDINLGDSYSSVLRVLKGYYKEGEFYYEEYMKHAEELGLVNMPDYLLDEIILDKWGNEGDYIKKEMEVYLKYSRTSLCSIIKLDERIKELKQKEKECEEEVGEVEVSKNKKRGINKVLDYFKKH